MIAVWPPLVAAFMRFNGASQRPASTQPTRSPGAIVFENEPHSITLPVGSNERTARRLSSCSAIWIAVRWALLVPAIELEHRRAFDALRRSGRLVSHGWLKVASLIVVGAALALLAGPFLGALLILVTSVPLVWINVISGLVYAVAMPFVALASVYVYFDMRVRDELGLEHGPEQLPAEIEFSG